jgi:hypothetical protein
VAHEILDVLLQRRGDQSTAVKPMRKLLRKLMFALILLILTAVLVIFGVAGRLEKLKFCCAGTEAAL